MSSRIELIVGLGNPGREYEATRHNAGFWFVDALARRVGAHWRNEGKFHGEVCKARVEGHELWLLKPGKFMNRSGQAVAAMANFYKIPADGILVVHDELDLPPGTLRLKRGGGHGGHNGLRDIIAQLGSRDFVRLRVGIGHPGHASRVTSYVLGKAPSSETEQMDAAIAAGLDALPLILGGDLQKAMDRLHSLK